MFAICSRIVVPYDNSESSQKALKMAITLASQDEKIQLYLITVLNAEIPDFEIAEEILSEIEQQLLVLANRTKMFILEGNPAQVILKFVEENDADFIVMGSRGLSGLKEMFLGSVSNYVVQKSSCPVLIIK